MAETERQLMFEGPAKEPNACASAGQETCGMVDKDTMTGIGTVYVNGSSVAAFFQEHALTQVDVLKIDAGLDAQYDTCTVVVRVHNVDACRVSLCNPPRCHWRTG